MAEETSVLGRMVIIQRSHSIWRVTLVAEFFRRLLLHLHEFDMVLIVGQMLGCLFRRSPEKEKEAAADKYKNQVVDEYVFSLSFLFFRVH